MTLQQQAKINQALEQDSLSALQEICEELEKNEKLSDSSDISFSSKFNHSFCENANKHPSNPFVTMNFSPMSCLNFAGIINLPFASRECSYSPISN